MSVPSSSAPTRNVPRAATSVIAVGVPRTVAAAIARQVHGTVSATKPTRNTIVASTHFAPDQVRISQARSGYRLELGARAARRLAADQTAFRYRYGRHPVSAVPAAALLARSRSPRS